MRVFLFVVAFLFVLSLVKVYYMDEPVEVGSGDSHKSEPATISADKLKALKADAKAGGRMAQYELGLLYARGANNLEQDYQQAHDLLHKSAMQGVPQAMYHLGEMYVWGDGVETDYEEATVWFWLATSLGDKYSEKRLRAINTRISAEALADAQARVEKLWKEIPHDLKIERQGMH